MVKDIRNAENIRGKKVLLRGTLNVPVNDGSIINDFRLKKTLNTINLLKDAGAKIILVGHIGRDESMSMSVVYEQLRKYINLTFTGELFGEKTNSAISEMKEGEVVLLENLRSHKGEIANDENFAKELASLADIYVNDAFSVCHREHASIVGVPKYIPSYAGLLLLKEIRELTGALRPPSPALCVIGGAKFKTKAPLIKKLLTIYDQIFITGALANDFFKANGFNVGKSLVSDDPVDIQVLYSNKKIRIPFDVTVKNDEGVFVKNPNEVLDNDIIVDIGPNTATQLGHMMDNFKFVLWNGPLGAYEQGFVEYTESLAQSIVKSLAETLVGGGDTIASIERLGLNDQFTFMSTGGGSMLKFLMDGTLVGIEALKKAN